MEVSLKVFVAAASVANVAAVTNAEPPLQFVADVRVPKGLIDQELMLPSVVYCDRFQRNAISVPRFVVYYLHCQLDGIVDGVVVVVHEAFGIVVSVAPEVNGSSKPVNAHVSPRLELFLDTELGTLQQVCIPLALRLLAVALRTRLP